MRKQVEGFEEQVKRVREKEVDMLRKVGELEGKGDRVDALERENKELKGKVEFLQ